MIQFLQKRKRVLCWFFVSVILLQTVGASTTYALTGGPSQPEVQGFTPAGTSDMVDVFSGDFSYNIPLFELPGPNGGYPFNLSYQSGISMDQEASWVGLGWSLNPGAITRQMRGLPDEFKDESVFTKMSIAPNVTVGAGLGVTFEIFGKDKGGLTVGFSVYQNNYKGMGYTIDGSVGYQKANSTEQNDNLGLSTSLDSQEGVSINPTIGLGTEIGTIGLGVGYNSKSGLTTVTITQDFKGEQRTRAQRKKDQERKKQQQQQKKAGTATPGKTPVDNAEEPKEMVKTNLHQSVAISLAHPGYTPQVTMPMRSVNVTGTFKLGAGYMGAFPDAYVTGFYNEQWLKHDKQRVRSGAFGYLHYQDVVDATALTDLNREKDGMVSTKTPNLGIPSLSYDIYSVNGQGISAMYRPMRNDYGIVHDPEAISKSTSVAAGVDVGIPFHVGINLSVNHSESKSGLWSESNQMISPATFQKKNADSEYEPWYFKVHGELTSEKADVINKLGGDNAVRVKLAGEKDLAYASNLLEKNTGWSQAAPVNSMSNRERKSRSQVIQTITNEELLSDGTEVLPQFKVKYIDENDDTQDYDRTGWPGHHIAAFTALTPEGLRYNYGIPAYNLHQEDVSFSVSNQPDSESRVDVQDGGDGDPNYSVAGTDKYLKRVELPEYAHAYLLTSIIGPDYVDVSGDGVTNDDLGYWVKFTYKRTSSSANPYLWRDPFSRAYLQKGWRSDRKDDKGSFVYGEKELFYLTKAETKSHIATFTLVERQDGKGVTSKFQGTEDDLGESVYALNEVRLYTRSAGTAFPIKIVKFEYDYTLCPGVYNNSSDGGKLTLKKVWFEYGNSGRGSLNPYLFTYHTNNPAYDILSFDRWGIYKPYPSGQRYYNNDFPYAEQDPTKKEQIDNNAAGWSLVQIRLPSGGTIMVDYESDDYAYVQHKQAMQMAAFVNPNGEAAQAESGETFSLDYYNPKIRFKLESPISGTLTTQEQKAEVLKYIDQYRKQLYFKININLLKDAAPDKEAFEFISGYADIDDTQPMGLEQVSGQYEYGYFYLRKENGFHPFAVRAWQHIRVNQPDLANYGSTLNPTSSLSGRIGLFKALATMASEIRKMFEGFNNFCRNKSWGKEVALGKSWIRLNSADKIKYGGGLRVKQITLKDDWAHDEEGIYGQVYDYTIDENGMNISSGVATYEPIAGGEENALHYAKKYVESVPLRSSNNLFFEYPINETYYPGPEVGYRKVTVMSLASAFLAGRTIKNITLSDEKALFPKGVTYGTTGMTVHEFYTAKDFPVITEETEIVRKPYQFAMMMPYFGSINISKLAATQGYSIITNDMHGRQKMISNYRQDKQGKFEPDPISKVKYNYLSSQKIYEQEKVSAIVNTFKGNADGTMSIASAADLANPAIQKFTIGQEHEFFTDMRQSSDQSWSGGARFNVEALYFFLGIIPVPSTWPAIGNTFQQLRTSSSNKIIFKSGILESVEAFDGGSRLTTKNLKWDKLTGATLLTMVNNDFDAPVFQYSVPAYTQYQGMGAAYQNIGLTFSVEDVQQDPYEDTRYAFSIAIAKDKLLPGDELILCAANASPVARVVFTGEEEGDLTLYSAVPLTEESYQAMIVRSGYRNQLGVAAGNITALEDPSEPGTPVTYTKTITIPQED